VLEIAFLVVDDDGMVPVADKVYVVLTVDGYSRHVAVNIVCGQLFSSFDDGIFDIV